MVVSSVSYADLSVSVVVVLSNNCGFVSSSEFSQLRYRQWYVHKRCQHFLQQNDILIYFMLTKMSVRCRIGDFSQFD